MGWRWHDAQEYRSLAALVLCAGASACSPYLHSPPGRMVPLEAAKALPKGDFAIQGAIAGGAAIWGPSVGAGTVQGRYGFGHGLEGALEAGFAVIGARDTEWSTYATLCILRGRASSTKSPPGLRSRPDSEAEEAQPGRTSALMLGSSSRIRASLSFHS